MSFNAQTAAHNSPRVRDRSFDFRHVREEIGLAGPCGLISEKLGTRPGRQPCGSTAPARNSDGQALRVWRRSEIVTYWTIERLDLLASMHMDATRPDESFGDVLANFLRGSVESSYTGDNVVEQIWCRTGRCASIIFLVGLFWRGGVLRGGEKWKENVRACWYIRKWYRRRIT